MSRIVEEKLQKTQIKTPSRVDHLVMPEEHMDKLYNSTHPLVRFTHRDRLRSIVNQIPGKTGLKIVDGGCGEGHLLEKIVEGRRGNDYFGIDITESALKDAEVRCPHAQYQCGNLSHTGYPDRFFDVVTCTEVIEHIYEWRQILMEFHRILKPEGRLIITFPNEVLWTASRFLLGRRPIKVTDHVNSFTPGIMRRAIPMTLLKQVNLPLRLPFFISLGALMVFQKNA